MISALLAASFLQQNSAVVPVNRSDAGWTARHEEMVKLAKSGEKFELVLIGDSITHGWGGRPQPNAQWKGVAPDHYDELFGPYKPLNLGISGDRTQHVLWRLDNGELEGVNPKVCMIMIGTNNVGSNTSAEVFEGISKIVDKVHEKSPKSKVLIIGILPRDFEITENRKKNDAVNEMIEKKSWPAYVTYQNVNKGFLDSEGKMSPSVMPDALHPNAAGYKIWGDAIKPTLAKLFSE
ncbi:MAG: hypothetical protein KF836_00300 [Fimbriimonadaceae bacterium]|nr:hypothetical protein [Fimbriimonadaceae bacterium]